MFLCWFEFEGEYLKNKLLDREEGSEEEVKLLWRGQFHAKWTFKKNPVDVTNPSNTSPHWRSSPFDSWSSLVGFFLKRPGMVFQGCQLWLPGNQTYDNRTKVHPQDERVG